MFRQLQKKFFYFLSVQKIAPGNMPGDCVYHSDAVGKVYFC